MLRYAGGHHHGRAHTGAHCARGGEGPSVSEDEEHDEDRPHEGPGDVTQREVKL